MLGKTYTKAECNALLNKDLATVARQINPYIKVDIPETTRGALYSFVYNGCWQFQNIDASSQNKPGAISKAHVISYVAGHMLAVSNGKVS